MLKVFKGIRFNDYTDGYFDEIDNVLSEDWSQICQCCVDKHKISDFYLDVNNGSGVCGVEGCENEADHYIDFIEVAAV